MKKWFSWALTWALLLCCAGAQAEAEPRYFYSGNPDIEIHQLGYPRQCYFSDGETAYRLSDGELWVLGKDFEPAAKLCDTTAMAGYACEGGIVLACPTEKGYRFEWLDGEVLFEAESDRLIREFVIVGDCLAARWMYVYGDPVSGDATRLTAYHLDGQERNVPFESVFDMDLAENGEIWLAETDGFGSGAEALYLWNPETDEIRQWQTDVVQPSALCSLPVGFACADIDGNVYVEEMPGEARSIGRAETGTEYLWNDIGLFVRGSKVGFFNYISYDDRLTLQAFDLEQKAENVLTLVNCAEANDWSMKQAVQMLYAAHPEIRVQAVELSDDVLRTRLMANEDGLDILYMDNSEGAVYAEAGVLEDLNQHPDILAELEAWVPLDGYTLWKGVRFGLLIDAYLEGLHMNESLRDYLPEGMNPERMTWRELLTAGAQFNGDTDGDGRQDVWLLNCDPRFPSFIHQYLRSGDDVAAVNLDTEEFRELMTLYRQCVQSGAFAEVDGDAAILSVEIIDTVDIDPHLPLPALENDDAGSALSAFYIGVNRASPKKELALELLRYYASAEAQVKSSIWDQTRQSKSDCSFLRDLGALDPYYDMLLTEADRANVEHNQALFSNSKVRWAPGGFAAYCGDQVDAYLDGQIELDELIENLQQRKQMVLMG